MAIKEFCMCIHCLIWRAFLRGSKWINHLQVWCVMYCFWSVALFGKKTKCSFYLHRRREWLSSVAWTKLEYCFGKYAWLRSLSSQNLKWVIQDQQCVTSQQKQSVSILRGMTSFGTCQIIHLNIFENRFRFSYFSCHFWWRCCTISLWLFLWTEDSGNKGRGDLQPLQSDIWVGCRWGKGLKHSATVWEG